MLGAGGGRGAWQAWGTSVESQAWEGGARCRAPWELSREIPLIVPFLQGRIRGTQAEGNIQRYSHLFLGSEQGGTQVVPVGRSHWEVMSPSGLRQTWEVIPVGYSLVQVLKPSDLIQAGSEVRETRGHVYHYEDIFLTLCRVLKTSLNCHDREGRTQPGDTF